MSWIRGVGRAFGWVVKAFLGKSVPRYVTVVADKHYFYPSQLIVESAIHELATLKIEAGFVYDNYRPESWDCDNAALFDYNALLNHILPDLCSHIPEAQKKGFACGMFE
ncbi:unnamed protein product, partial [marine sediment metagenome]